MKRMRSPKYLYVVPDEYGQPDFVTAVKADAIDFAGSGGGEPTMPVWVYRQHYIIPRKSVKTLRTKRGSS